jgi:PAS domain S-box-containing protein
VVIRQSCGCANPLVAQIEAATLEKDADCTCEERLKQQCDAIQAELMKAVEGSGITIEPIKQIVNAFVAEMTSTSQKRFLTALETVVQQYAVNEADGNMTTAWHTAVSVLRQNLLPCIDSSEQLAQTERLWQQAHIVIGETERRGQLIRELRKASQASQFRALSAKLISTFDIAELMDILAEELPRFGIACGLVAMYDDPQPYVYPQTAPILSRVLLAYHAGGRKMVEDGAGRIRSDHLMPDGFLSDQQCYNLVAVPLYFRQTQIGFALLDGASSDSSLYRNLQGAISSALQGALLVQGIREQSAEIARNSAEIARQKYILDTFIETVPDRIWFKDREGRFTRANQAHALALGLEDPREEIGKTDADFYGGKTANTQTSDEQEILRTGRPMLNKEVSSTGPDGSLQWLLVTKMPLLDEHQNIIGTFGISRDFTALKHAQEELQKHAHELAAAYEEIHILNTQLQEENLRMSAELDVSRRIQQMVLPSPQELQQIPDLDIVGYMQPADEVGGDYYDVLDERGTVHVGIGDVTGHGLESGILMLMTQTAIRTLIEHGETDPKTFLTTLNRVILKNAQRMGVDKTLTFTLLQYQAGHIHIVGQHEEILILRQGGQIERVDTLDLGFPIGLEIDIAKFVDDAAIRLQPGESVVLYTDGITEAENPDNQMYGIDRLCAVLSQHWDRSAEVMKQAVIADVTSHIGTQKVYDDVTLVVLKQQ